jgi:hypothetical protein
MSTKTVDCAGCGKQLEDDYKERAIYTVAGTDYKVCPGRRSYMGEPDPSAACAQKLLRKQAATCYGCGETSVIRYQGQVCDDCKTKIAQGNEVQKPVHWVGLDPNRFFTREYFSESEDTLEAVQLLARAIKGQRRLSKEHPGFGSDKLGGEHPKVYVEVDEDQLEALHQLQKLLARVGDAIERKAHAEGTNLLGQLASGKVKPDDFDQWAAKAQADVRVPLTHAGVPGARAQRQGA